MTLLWWLILGSVAICYIRCNPVDNKTAKKFQFAIMQQNLQTIIMSIEERLRNLDAIYSSRSANGLDGTLEEFSRKLDKIELKLAHIETIMHLQLDKISENVSVQYMKEDINRDHIKKKLDVIHENVNNRLTYNEIKLDTIGQNERENNNLLKNKLQKLEDKFTSKLSDIEVAISDSIVSLEDAKDVCTSTINTTNDKLSDNVEKTILKYVTALENKYNAMQTKILDNIITMESNIKRSLNRSYEIIIDVEDNFNEFSNKISEMGDTIYDKSESIETNAIAIAKIINTTRNEIQNGFRTMMVQMGKREKNTMLRDSSEMLHEMDKKIENNFENILLAQNIILQTCHGLQMEDSQMENKIGDIFQKLLDTLDSKMLVEATDIKEINKVLGNILSKNKSTINTFDGQYLYDLLKSVDQIQKQLISMENGINKTIGISEQYTENQNILQLTLADIQNLFKTSFDSNKLILMGILMKSKVDNGDSICNIFGCNCTKDILQHNQTDVDSIVFKDDNNNSKQNLLYNIGVRTLMNANNENMSIADGINDAFDIAINNFDDLVDSEDG